MLDICGCGRCQRCSVSAGSFKQCKVVKLISYNLLKCFNPSFISVLPIYHFLSGLQNKMDRKLGLKQFLFHPVTDNRQLCCVFVCFAELHQYRSIYLCVIHETNLIILFIKCVYNDPIPHLTSLDLQVRLLLYSIIN